MIYVTVKGGKEIKLYATNEEVERDEIEKYIIVDISKYRRIYTREEYYSLYDDWDELKREGLGRIYDKWIQSGKYMIQIVYKSDNPNGHPGVADFVLEEDEWKSLEKNQVVPINYDGYIKNNPINSYTKFYNKFDDWSELSEYDSRIYEKWISTSQEYIFTLVVNRASKNATYTVMRYRVDKATYQSYNRGDIFTIE